MSNASDFIIENGVLKKYLGPGGDVVVPEGVTEIGNGSFLLCDTIKSIQLPDGITIIGQSSFSGCKNMEHITLPTSIEKIGFNAFGNCISLNSISAPNVKEIESMAFAGCKSLCHVDIPDSGVNIGNSAFHRCERLQDGDGFVIWENILHSYCGKKVHVVIPNSVTGIGDYAFAYIHHLEEVVIPSSVERIGSYAFGGNDNLRSITIPDSVLHIGDYAFADDPMLKTIIASEQVYKLAWETLDPEKKREFALAYLETGEIPAAVASYINKNAATIIKTICHSDDVNMMENFLKIQKKITPAKMEKYLAAATNHLNLTALLLEYQRKNIPMLDANPFELTERTEEIPQSPKTAADWKKIFKFSDRGNYLVVSGYKAEMSCITVPASIGKKPVLAVEDMGESIHLQKVIVSTGVTRIMSRAFSGCENLKEIHLPDSVDLYWKPQYFSSSWGLPFYGCPELTIYGSAGSSIETYAKEKNIPFVAE